MAKCNHCGKEYWAYDEDAGTYKEHFCSVYCEQGYELELDLYFLQQEEDEDVDED